jgi:hypothetical protein
MPPKKESQDDERPPKKDDMEWMGAAAQRAELFARAGVEPMNVGSLIPEFDLDEQDWHHISHWTWLICGMTGTGKSWLIKYILYKLRKVLTCVWVFSHTKSNGFYQQFLPNHLIVRRYDPDLIDRITQLQEVRSSIRGINPHVAIILDDVASEVGLRYEEATRKLAMEGRHQDILTIMTSQHYSTIPTQVRTNARWAAVFNTDHQPTARYIFEEITGVDFISFEAWYLTLQEHTKDHRCLIIHRNPELRGKERYFTFKAPDLSKTYFHVGYPFAWRAKNPAKAAAIQRQHIKEKLSYSRSYLERMRYVRRTPFPKQQEHQEPTEDQERGEVEGLEHQKEESPFDIFDV